MSYVIFSIDNGHSIKAQFNFYSDLISAKAQGHIKDNVVQCIGGWEHKLENSYLVTARDYKYISGLEALKNQDCAVKIKDGVTRKSSLLYSDGREVQIGNMTKVSKDEAMWNFGRGCGFTYRPDVDTWWMAWR